MILALSLVTLVGAVVVGVADYPQTYVVEVHRVDGTDPAMTTQVVGYAERELSCPGPLRTDELVPLSAADGVIVSPLVDGSPEPCRYERDKRQAGTWLTIALSGLAALTALALLRRSGPSPDLDPPQPDPITREVPDL